jgi:hypothetical protein
MVLIFQSEQAQVGIKTVVQKTVARSFIDRKRRNAGNLESDRVMAKYASTESYKVDFDNRAKIELHSSRGRSTAKGAVLADTSEALPSTHARAPHATSSTEEKLAITVSAAEAGQVWHIPSLNLCHTSTLRETFERAPGVAYILRSAAANTIDRADTRVSTIERRRDE